MGPERLGSIAKFVRSLENCQITEFNYRYQDTADALLFVGISVAGFSERIQLLDKMTCADFSVEDVTDDDIAKNHIRHMVGGKGSSYLNERIFEVVFRERLGAFRDLSSTLPPWNITLTHYHNQGGHLGRVLIGFDIPHQAQTKLMVCWSMCLVSGLR